MRRISDSYKAGILSGSIAIVVMALLFSFKITPITKQLATSYYVIEPETEPHLESEKTNIQKNTNLKPNKTNKAFNEMQKSSQFAPAFQPIAPPKDYVFTKEKYTEAQKNANNKAPIQDSHILESDLNAYQIANALLHEQQSLTQAQKANTQSNVTYALRNRTHIHLPTPAYLCETSGQVIITITVTNLGTVINPIVNTAASSKNKCLQEHALAYAKSARFNAISAQKNQIGSITFYFEGKH
ncbi:energy transducer TonB [Bizionia sediminis]|uniref:Energy transducer TonB n=1 Tax=Bizionia sediminis TaxID=1737064 RepID=A0ABW5KS56_9FLAO